MFFSMLEFFGKNSKNIHKCSLNEILEIFKINVLAVIRKY